MVALRATLLALAVALAPAGSGADEFEGEPVQMDFQDQELKVVIDTIARATKKNFIYDDRVRGRVTIVSPTAMPLEQAYAVFESVLQVKGFTIVETPGGALKIIPLRDAKETSVETVASSRPPPNRDRFVTRLIPLRYIDADSIVNTLKPLVSKDAAMAAYGPTNTVILTESSSNIRRIIAILESIDIELYKEELAVIRVEFADASTMAQQISEIYGAEVARTTTTSAAARRSSRSRRSGSAATTTTTSTGTPPGMPPGQAGKVRILTDERTNSLIVLAPRTQLEEVRRLVRKLDVPVSGGGRIHVYYLQHADAEELAQTLSSMISGVPAAPAAAGGAAGAQAIRATVTGLAEGISVTADPATNSLIIQASQEGFNTLGAVIEKLDVPRPQVLIEALIMEVDVTDAQELGFNGLVRLVTGDLDLTVATATDSVTFGGLSEEIAAGASAGATGGAAPVLGGLLANFLSDSITNDDGTEGNGTAIRGILRAAASDSGTNILSSPHILTSDNEEAEIRIGDNIPIISSRVEAAVGGPSISNSVNVERQDIGVTLRVTPQITEGDTVRLDIYQEITAVNTGLQSSVGDVNSVGPALSNRRVENTVVVGNGETVVIGGLLADDYQDSVSKVPWLGDIPFLGWAFKTTTRSLRKINLLVFLTPHIVRSRDELLAETIRKREEFRNHAQQALKLTSQEEAWEHQRMKEAEAKGEPYTPGRGLNPARHALLDHAARYPLERMLEIERKQREAAEERARAALDPQPEYYLQSGLFTDESKAVDTLTTLVDLGYDGTLVTTQQGGRMLYEVRVGPYEDLDTAGAAIKVLERSTGLAPSILVLTPELQ